MPVVTISYNVGPGSAAHAAVAALAKKRGLVVEATQDTNRETIHVDDTQALNSLLAELKQIDNIQTVSA